MTEDRRRRLLVSCTVPVTAWSLMNGQLRHFREAGYEVVLLTSPGPLLESTVRREGVTGLGVRMEREIALRTDLGSLRRLVRAVREVRPDVTYVGTPKAGLLVGLAAFMCRVPHRVYVLRGLRLESSVGAQRAVLWALEWLSIRLAHTVVVVSPSLLAEVQRRRLGGSRDLRVLGYGSSNGVDAERFAPGPEGQIERHQLRATFTDDPQAWVFGFVGRLTVDKGMRELATAFLALAARRDDVHLLVLGEADDADESMPSEVRRLWGHPRVVATGWREDPASGYHAMDALVLPTYREGFPNVCLEAAAAALPVLTTTATGAVDAVVDGVTGLLVPPRDARALEQAMERMVGDRLAAREMGNRGRQRVEEKFRSEDVAARLTDLFDGGGSEGAQAT